MGKLTFFTIPNIILGKENYIYAKTKHGCLKINRLLVFKFELSFWDRNERFIDDFVLQLIVRAIVNLIDVEITYAVTLYFISCWNIGLWFIHMTIMPLPRTISRGPTQIGRTCRPDKAIQNERKKGRGFPMANQTKHGHQQEKRYVLRNLVQIRRVTALWF